VQGIDKGAITTYLNVLDNMRGSTLRPHDHKARSLPLSHRERSRKLNEIYNLSICKVKPFSQIHRFHLRLSFDALTACFLVISVGGRTTPLLLQYCSSSFFHAVGAPFKAPASFNFLNVGGGPLKKCIAK
jgi:hypothetical protein